MLHLLLKDVYARVILVQLIAWLVRIFVDKLEDCTPVITVLICMLLVKFE